MLGLKLSFPLPETCSFQVWNSTLPFLLNPSASESLSVVASAVRHLQTTIFGTCPLHRSGRQLSLPLDLRFAVLLAHNRFLFSSASNGGKLLNPVSLRNSCFVGINNKPPSLRPSGFVVLLPQGWHFCHLQDTLTKGFYVLLPNSSVLIGKIDLQVQS